jgi:hypothetical protein
MTRPRCVGRAAVVLLAPLLLAPCSVDKDKFYRRTFSCDSTQRENSCGSDGAGMARSCFPVRGLDGQDFCADTCGEGAASDAGALCTANQARLDTCRPNQAETAKCPREGFSCVRTDLIADEGVCLPVAVCDDDSECRSPARATCGATIVKEYYGQPTGLRTDHSFCLQAGCEATLSACRPGESCLPKVVVSSHLPDICVPNCDANLNCPPNFFCFRKVSGAAARPVCIPGILGMWCTSGLDCMIGDCADTGVGFSVCAVPCRNDADCLPFGRARGEQLCTTLAGGNKYCVSPVAVGGPPCESSSDCRPEESCVDTPLLGDALPRECLLRCPADGRCPARAGIPHACVPPRTTGDPAYCHAGTFAVRCTDSSECVGGLECLPTTMLDEAEQVVSLPTCSIPCRTDADCGSNRFVRRPYCDGAACSVARGTGARCGEDRECVSRRCALSSRADELPAGIRRCAAAEASP